MEVGFAQGQWDPDLDMPVNSDAAEAERFRELGHVHGIGQILLIGQNQHWDRGEVLVLQKGA